MRFRPEPRAPICPHKDYFIGATQEVVPNPTYEDDLRKYDAAYRQYVADHEQWRRDKEKHDAQKEEDFYLKLHAKYGEGGSAYLKLKEELDRIKEGIKRNRITTIVDGNDLCDWGWMTHRDHNERMRELEKK